MNSDIDALQLLPAQPGQEQVIGTETGETTCAGPTCGGFTCTVSCVHTG